MAFLIKQKTLFGDNIRTLKISRNIFCKLSQQQTRSPITRYIVSDAMPDTNPRNIEKSINQVTLLGRVGGDPQKRGTEKHPVVIFSLATNSKFEIAGEINVKTDWHRISVFKPALRDIVYTYLQKGQRVYVTGRISYGEIKDEMGNSRPTTSIIAEDIVFFQSSE